jgi:hypothetical protein
MLIQKEYELKSTFGAGGFEGSAVKHTELK